MRSVEPGTVLRWTPGGSQNVALLRAAASRRIAAGDPPDYAVEELRCRFADAVRRQLLSDVPIALMASGGVDSSLIWWAAGGRVERAYTIEWADVTGDERLSEDAAAVRDSERPARYAGDLRAQVRRRPAACHARATCSPTQRTILLAPSRAGIRGRLQGAVVRPGR